MAAPVATQDRIGETLVREGLITKDQLSRALQEQTQSGNRLGYCLVKLGYVDENELTRILARQYRMPAVDLTRFEVDPRIIKLVPSDLATKHLVLPLKRDGRTLTVAMADPGNIAVIDDLKFITRCDIFPVIAGEFTLRNFVEKHYEGVRSADGRAPQGHRRDALGDIEVVETVDEEMSAAALAVAVRGRAGRQAHQRHPDRCREARSVATSTSNASSTSCAFAIASTARSVKS